jgi:hypothetical protein
MSMIRRFARGDVSESMPVEHLLKQAIKNLKSAA